MKLVAPVAHYEHIFNVNWMTSTLAVYEFFVKTCYSFLFSILVIIIFV